MLFELFMFKCPSCGHGFSAPKSNLEVVCPDCSIVFKYESGNFVKVEKKDKGMAHIQDILEDVVSDLVEMDILSNTIKAKVGYISEYLEKIDKK